MTKKIGFVVLAISILFLYSSSSFAQQKYVINNTTIYPVPNISKPAKGQTVVDPNFGVKITRITDASESQWGGCTDVHTPYYKNDIENADGTMLVVKPRCGGQATIISANYPYNIIRNIPNDPVLPLYPRWDHIDPNILYYEWNRWNVNESKFYKFNVSTGVSTMIHDWTRDFPQYKTLMVSCMDEGTPSEDAATRYWAFQVDSASGRGTSYIVYDKNYYSKDNGKIIYRIDQFAKYPDGTGNPYYVPYFPGGALLGYASMYPDARGTYFGDALATTPLNLSSVNYIPYCCHADMSISVEGNYVIFGFATKFSRMGPGSGEYNAAVMTNVDDPAASHDRYDYTLLGRDTNGNVPNIGCPRYGFSGNNYEKPGWGLMSTYQTNTGYGCGTGDFWNDMEMVMFELTTRTSPPPRMWRLGKIMAPSGYTAYPLINKRGTHVYFTSNWNVKGGNSDIYRIDLPPTWYQDLMGKLPPNTDKTPPAIPKGFKVLK